MTATILVAEDERPIADILSTILEDEGYTVLRATDGAEALALAEREQPDLVVSDIMMPRLSGIDLAWRLRGRAHGQGPPILLLSAVLRPMTLPPRTAFLAKPFDLDRLLALVATLLPA